MAWAKNGTPDTLSGTGDALEITDLSSQKFNVFLCHALPSGNMEPRIQFDADSGSNYADRNSGNGATDTTATSQTEIRVDDIKANNQDHFTVGYYLNISSEEKLGISFTHKSEAAGAASAPNRIENAWKWANTSDSVSQFSMDNAAAGDFVAGTNLSAIGTD